MCVPIMSMFACLNMRATDGWDGSFDFPFLAFLPLSCLFLPFLLLSAPVEEGGRESCLPSVSSPSLTALPAVGEEEEACVCCVPLSVSPTLAARFS